MALRAEPYPPNEISALNGDITCELLAVHPRLLHTASCAVRQGRRGPSVALDHIALSINTRECTLSNSALRLCFLHTESVGDRGSQPQGRAHGTILRLR